jgi:hypothetical protein
MAAQEITTPLATPERSADVLGVSKARTAKLIRWARGSASRSLLEKPGSSSAPTNGKARSAKQPASSSEDFVFLNVPYDPLFAPPFLAYICGICAFGLIPRAALELQGGTRRLDRIISLIESCRYSIHDMSRVELDTTPPPTPRFNMPFELGLSVLHASRNPNNHSWFLFESVKWRIQKSLSDLNGTDPYIHDGTVDGVFRELAKAFIRSDRQPSVQQMRFLYDKLEQTMRRLLTDAAATDPFNARAFQDTVVFTTALTQTLSQNR